MKDRTEDETESSPPYHLRLFIAGEEPNSMKAVRAVKELCATRLKGKCRLEIVDVLEDYQSALDNNIFFAPTLVIFSPKPQTKIVGSLNDPGKLLEALGLQKFREEA